MEEAEEAEPSSKPGSLMAVPVSSGGRRDAKAAAGGGEKADTDAI